MCGHKNSPRCSIPHRLTTLLPYNQCHDYPVGVVGFSTTSKQVVGQGGRADDIKARIVRRRIKVG